ncbi:UNVERIFIED_CONTAM: hypothetical protein HDU68_004613 [Siphonaria sp. JEL0065]|nr:hypothetical protein HDU68_004613 [Siphonaria sp. JEL0065]
MESEIFSQLRRGINDLEGTDETPFANGSASYDNEESFVNDLAATSHAGGKAAIDLNSEDLFPALPPSASTAPKLTQAWRPAVSKPAVVVTPGTKELGTGKRVAESVQIPLNLQQKLSAYGKDSINNQTKSIGLLHRVTIEALPNRTTFVITGKPEQVKLARRDLLTGVGVYATEIVLVPASVRPHILGAGGKKLKDLTDRTGTKIEIPKATQPAEGQDVDDDEEQPVTIRGSYALVLEAKKEIEEIVSKRTSKHTIKIEVDRAFHPFIAGANNSTVQEIELKTGTRIHIPPLVAPEQKEGVSEKNLNEIVIVGSKEGAKIAQEEIQAKYEELERTTRTLSFPVKKRQHRFIIGSKGVHLQEILEATGCSVELPAASDPSENITVRGPDNMLSVALHAVLQKSSTISLEEIHIARSIPASTNPLLFLRYLFTKEIAQIKKIETANTVTVHRLVDKPSDPILEIQGQTKLGAEAARIQLNQLIHEWGQSLFFGVVEIPHGLHKFVVGTKGANIASLKAQPVWEGRLADTVVPTESEGSDEILLVVRRLPRGLGAATNAKPATKKPAGAAKAEADDDAEVAAFAEKVRAEILSVSLAKQDFTSEVVAVPGKFHGRLIGAGGKDLKELLAPYGDEVSIRFPVATGKEDAKKKDDKKVDADTVVIKGPKKLVADCKAKLAKVLVELKRIETLGSFTDTLKVKKGTGKKLREGAGAPVSSGSKIVNEHGRSDTIGWLVRLIKENLTANPPKAVDAVTAENNHMLGLLKLEVTESAKDADDVLTFTGPKDIVAIAKKIISERAVLLANQVTVEFKVFHIVSKAAKEVLAENLIPDLKNRVMRKLIGRQGKSVKDLMEKYGVAIQFPEGGKKRKNNNDEDIVVVDVEEVEEETEASKEVVDGIVIVKGSPKQTEAVKAEILKIAEAEIVNSYTTSFEVPRSVLPQILGSAGSKIKALRETHNIRIDLKDLESEDGEVSVLISLEGSKADCLAVEKKILGTTDELVNVEIRSLAVPSYLHKDIIGAAGARVKAIIDSFGGQDKVKIQFPPRGDSSIGGADSNIISIKAHVRQIDELAAAVLNVVNEVLVGGDEEAGDFALIDETRDEVTTQTISIPKGDVSRLLGKGGDSIKSTLRKFRVIYWFSESGDSENVDVKVVGLAGNEDGVKQAIDDIKGKLRTTKKIALPAKVRQNLATAGSIHDAEAASVQELIKKVRAVSSGAASAEISNSSLAGSEDAFITVRGDAKYVDIAVKSIENGLLDLTKYDITVRIPIEADIRGHIIGKAGITITTIRDETGAFVELAKGTGRNAGDVVVIRGTVSAVEQATERVQEIITQQAKHAAVRAANAAQKASAFSVGPARIDDPAAEDQEYSAPAPSGPATIPGFAPSQKGAKGKKPAVPVTVVSSAPSYYSSFTAAPVEDSWKPVAKKSGKKEETTVVGATTVADVPGAGPSKKKKKNKNKGVASAVEEAEAAPEPVTAPVRASSPARARSPSPVKAPAPVARAASPARAPAKTVVDTLKPAVASAPTPSPSPAVAVAAKSLAAPRAAPVVQDDGWTVIPKKFGAGEEEIAKKKKKKNKKKKTSGATGAVENGDDEGDE